jgi:hypothetical protein
MAKTGHRTGVWKQSNKTHKTGGHRSKGAIRASVSGKPTGGKVIHSGKAGLSTKSTRKHQVKRGILSILWRISWKCVTYG